MRWSSLCHLLLLSACGAPLVTQKKLSDGSIQVSCELPMDDCLRRVQDQCERQRYRILEGTSETRLRDAPPYEQEYHTSRVHLVCTSGPPALLSLDSPAPKPTTEAPPPARACVKGETRACVGPAACKGGQACLADGTGFGACDCGPAAAPATDPAPPATAAESPSPPSSSPAPSPSPGPAAK